MAGDSNDVNNFRHNFPGSFPYFFYKLLLTPTRVSRLHEAGANGSLANIKVSKTQVKRMFL